MSEDFSLIREEIALSKETVDMLKELKVLIINCGKNSFEIIKNLSLINIKQIGIFGDDIIMDNDLHFNYIFKSRHKKKSKKDILKEWTDDLISITNVKIHEYNFDILEEIMKEYDIAVVSDFFILKMILKIDEICTKLNKKMIYCGTLRNMGFVFFNLNYIKMTDRHISKELIPIKSITQANPGVVTTTKKHNFLAEDFIWIQDVNGMNGIFPEEIRPIIKVIDDYSFTIEDTSSYTAYVNGGLVSGANFPKNIQYNSIKNQFNAPTFNNNLSKEVNFKYHINFLIFLHIIDINSVNYLENFENLYEEGQKRIEKIKFGNMPNKDLSDKDMVFSFLKDFRNPKINLNHFFVANIVVCEITKINGKFKPFQQTLYLKFPQHQGKNLKALLNQNIFLIGAGGKSHEIIKQFIYICSAFQTNLTINISDDSIQTKSSLGTNFFFKDINSNIRKDKKLVKEINSNEFYLELNLIEKSQFLNTMNKSDFVIVTINDFEKILNLTEMAMLTDKQLLITNEFNSNLQCLKILKENKEFLEDLYPKKAFEINLLNLNSDNPNGSLDCIKWTCLIFEFVFQSFFLDESFFNDVNKKSPFFYLIIFLKTRVYKFLLFQKHKLDNLVNEGVYFFHIMFIWYYHIMKNWDFSFVKNYSEKIFYKIEKFDTENKLHLDFVISFVKFFNAIFTKSLSTIKDDEIVEILKKNYNEFELPINKFNSDYFMQDFKTCYNEINYADKYQNYYNIIDDLRFFNIVKKFGSTINDIKIQIHGYEIYTSNEFEYFFFDSISTLCFNNSFLANFVFWKINQKDDEKNLFLNWQNTSMKIN